MITCSRCGNQFDAQGPPPPAGATVLCPRCAGGAAGAANAPRYAAASAARGSNAAGLIGFIFSLVGIFTLVFFIPGLILSLVGLRKEPRGMAVAGTIISGLGTLVICVLALFIGTHFHHWVEVGTRGLAGADELVIVQQCEMYSQNNNSMFPPNLATLVADGQVLPGNLVDPLNGTMPLVIPASHAHDVNWIGDHLKNHCNFVYVGKGVNNAGSSVIVLYTNPATIDLGHGLEICFADMHIVWIPAGKVAGTFASNALARKAEHLPAIATPVLPHTH